MLAFIDTTITVIMTDAIIPPIIAALLLEFTTTHSYCY